MKNKTSEWTKHKHLLVREIAWKISGVAANNFKAYPNWIKGLYFIDLNGGDGGTRDDPSSCVTFARILYERHLQYHIPFDLVVFEKDHLEQLQTHIDISDHHIFYKDNALVTSLVIPGKRFGLVYADPYAGCDFIPLLIQLEKNPKFQHVDFLINLNPASIKRVDRAHGKCRNCQYGNNINDCLGKIGKIQWRATKPFKRWQWTLVLATNAPEHTFNMDNVPWLSPVESKELIEELSKTNAEKQQQLSFISRIPEAPAIPGSQITPNGNMQSEMRTVPNKESNRTAPSHISTVGNFRHLR